MRRFIQKILSVIGFDYSLSACILWILEFTGNLSLTARVFGGLAIVVSLVPLGDARAATLSFSGIGTPGVLGGNFNPSGLPAINADGVGVGSAITIFSGLGNTGGLSLAANTTVTFTFMGKEAGFTNQLLFGNTVLFDNNVAPGTPSATLTVNAGSVPFLFRAPGNLDANDDGQLLRDFKSVLSKFQIPFSTLCLTMGAPDQTKILTIWWSGSLPPRSLLHFLALFRSSPPASARWVCSAGAGSGRTQPPDQYI